MARFEELDVWKKSARLSANLYKEFAELKDFGFRDQITRSGLLVPSNIFEGYERNSDKELANFLNYAKGLPENSEPRFILEWKLDISLGMPAKNG